jgi:hypothetical protein
MHAKGGKVENPMSSKRTKRHDQKLLDAWQVQRQRADSWEIKPFPDLEWAEIRAFLNKTASTIAAIVATPGHIELELIELFGSYLRNETSGQLPATPNQTPSQAWTELRQSGLKGTFVDAVNRLHAYASIGTLLDHDLPKDPDRFSLRMNEDLQLLAKVLSLLPKASPGETSSSSTLTLQMIHDIAQARLSVDEGVLAAPAFGLAWLGGVSPKTIQNSLSRKQLQAGGHGAVDARSARAWLASRSDWPASCWREAIEVIAAGLAAPFREFEDAGVPDDSAQTDDGEADWVFVPRAGDGSLFIPELMRDRGWTVGPRGGERTFGDYWRALDTLARAARPCWRRPNPVGAFNVVIGKDWVRLTRPELELQLKSALAGERRK